MQTAHKFRLPQWLNKRQRGDLEDISSFYLVFLPIGIVLMLFGQELLKVHEAYQLLYNAAQLACQSGATQAMYVPDSVSAGAGFQGTINQAVARAVTKQDFSDEMQSDGAYGVLNVGSIQVSFPAGNKEQVQVTATYQPTGLFADIGAIDSWLGGDNTTKSGAYTITARPTFTLGGATMGISANSILNSSFESPNVAGSSNGYEYNPIDPTGAWTFVAGSGVVVQNNSPWGTTNAPDGSQMAFLQSSGAISQTFAVAASGTYNVIFDAALRTNSGGQQTFNVLIDGNNVGTFSPTSGSFTAYGTSSLTLNAGTHTLEFQGTTSTDCTDFIDSVVLGSN